MDMQIALFRDTHPRPHAQAPWLHRLAPWLVLAALAGWLLHAAPPPAAGPAETVSIAPLVRWKDTRHDWLLVVDPATRDLVVYDARDGRPLRRLGAASGLMPIDTIAAEGDRLLVTSEQRAGLRVLSLPELQPVALAGD